MLKENRKLFLSKKCKFTYSGYAHSQLKRIKTHRQWLLNPLDKKPLREDFGLKDGTKMSAEYMGYIESVIVAQDGIDRNDLINLNVSIENIEIPALSKDIMRLYEAERKYRNARNQWEQYQNWLKTRNPKRAKLEKKFGYDTKHASHLFRLLVQGEDILLYGDLNVRLKDEDREFVLAIKCGAYNFDQIIEMANNYEGVLDKLYDESELPRSSNFNAINSILVNVIEEFHRGS